MESYNILIVDDEESVVNSIQSELEIISQKAGHNNCIFTSNKPSSAKRILNKRRIDILFVDYLFDCGEKLSDFLEFLEDSDLTPYTAIVSGFKKNRYESTEIKVKTGQSYHFKKNSEQPLSSGDISSIYTTAITYLDGKKLPNPLHRNKLKYDSVNEDRYCDRLSSLFIFCEFLVRYSNYLILSDIREYNRKSSNKLIPYFYLKKYYQFGLSHEILNALLEQVNQYKCSIKRMLSIFSTSLSNGEQPIDFLGRVLEKRNSKSHPFSSYSEYDCKSLLCELTPEFNELKGRLRILSDYPLIYLEGIDDDYKYVCKLLMGDEFIGNESNFESQVLKKIKVNSSLELKKVYVKNRKRLISLDPFIKLFRCNKCNSNVIFLMNGIPKKDSDLVEYKCMSNHELLMSKIDDSQKFKSLLDTGL